MRLASGALAFVLVAAALWLALLALTETSRVAPEPATAVLGGKERPEEPTPVPPPTKGISERIEPREAEAGNDGADADRTPRTGPSHASTRAGLELRGRVIDTEGRPVSGARILAATNVEHPERGPMLPHPPDAAWITDHGLVDRIARGESGTDGRFRVSVPFQRRVVVAVRATEHRDLDRELRHTGAAPIHELGDLVLEPGASVSGIVVDANGAPVGDARIEHRKKLAGTTGADGSFRVDGLQLGKSVLWVKAQGHAPLWHKLSLTSLESWTRIVLSRGGTLAGRVVGPDAEGHSVWLQVGGREWDVPCGKNGAFRFEGLPVEVGSGRPAEYRLRAYAAPRRTRPYPFVSPVVPAHPGEEDVRIYLRTANVFLIEVLDAQTGTPLDAVKFAITRSDRETGEVEHERLAGGQHKLTAVVLPKRPADLRILCQGYETHTIAGLRRTHEPRDLGRVLLQPLAPLRLRVVDGRDDRPLEDVRVRAHPLHATWPLRHEGTTDADGKLTLPITSPKPLRVFIAHPGFAPVQEDVRDPAREHTVRLPAPGTVVLRVVDSAGKPLRGVTIRHHAGEEHRGSLGMHPSTGEGRTNPDGMVTFAGLVAGHHCFASEQDELGMGRVATELVAGTTKRLLLQVHLVRLHGQVSIHGVAAAGLKLQLNAHASTTTDVRGRYVLDALAGKHTLSISHPELGYLGSVRVGLDPPAVERNLRLDPRVVRGVVRDTEGRPLGGVKLHLARKHSGPRIVTSGDDGAFEFGHKLAADNYFVKAFSRGWKPMRVGPLDFGGSGPVEVGLVLVREPVAAGD